MASDRKSCIFRLPSQTRDRIAEIAAEKDCTKTEVLVRTFRTKKSPHANLRTVARGAKNAEKPA